MHRFYTLAGLLLGLATHHATAQRVGIGTTTPTATLHVAGSGSSARVDGLGGTGTRLVTVDADGTLSTSAQQSGSSQIGSSGGASFKTVTITFPVAYAAAPGVVICTARNEDDGSYDDTFAVSVRRVTTTGFEVNVKRVDNTASWGQNLLLNWIALP